MTCELTLHRPPELQHTCTHMAEESIGRVRSLVADLAGPQEASDRLVTVTELHTLIAAAEEGSPIIDAFVTCEGPNVIHTRLHGMHKVRMIGALFRWRVITAAAPLQSMQYASGSVG